uniref:Uncharacterized protein n=1 Tax=Timema bartmani TaxID=61472 RepID=A0A7R9EYV5_9NEOP|nr:unnamed protein product [Timema bartmani]
MVEKRCNRLKPTTMYLYMWTKMSVSPCIVHQQQKDQVNPAMAQMQPSFSPLQKTDEITLSTLMSSTESPLYKYITQGRTVVTTLQTQQPSAKVPTLKILTHGHAPLDAGLVSWTVHSKTNCEWGIHARNEGSDLFDICCHAWNDKADKPKLIECE